MAKIHEIYELAGSTAEQVVRSPRDWMRYLDTAAKLYRYSFSDSLLIHAQRPDATACASMELWNKKMNRWVNRGAHGIALIDDTGQKKRLKYVFDISDTHTHLREGGRTPVLWKIEERHQRAVFEHLTDVYGLEGSNAVNLQSALNEIAVLQENLDETAAYLEARLEGTHLAGMGQEEIYHEFCDLLRRSSEYILQRRCGFNPMDSLSEEDFRDIIDFNSLYVLSFLGNAIHEFVEPMLIDIGRTVRKIKFEELQKTVDNANDIRYNEFNTLKRESNNVEGGTQDGTDLSQEGRLSVPESDNQGNRSNNREIRDAAPDILKREPGRTVSGDAADRGLGRASDGYRKRSHGEDGSSDEGAPSEVPGSGQGDGSAGLDRSHERFDGNGGRERPEGIGIQLVEDTTEQDLSEAEEKQASALFLPDLPTVEQQKREIEERMQALYAGEVAIPSDVIDEVLRSGGNRNVSQLRIIYNFMTLQTPEEYTEFVRREYGKGGIGLTIDGTEYSVWYDELGMMIAVGHTVEDRILDKTVLSWDDVSGRIHQLLKQGEYAPQVVLDAARDNALKEHASALAYMHKDMADGVAELVFEDVEVFRGGFPDKVERLSELIAQPEYLSDLIERLEGLAEAYEEDHGIMRFQLYNPLRILAQFQKFAKEAVPYLARDGFAWEKHPVFITEDEINAFLREGGGYSDRRLAIYAFFIQDKTDKEKTDFIKESYGIGRQSHVLSGADRSYADYSGKGLKLARGSHGNLDTEVMLKWPKVAKRVAALIENGNYLKPSDYSRMPVYEREQMADRIINFYDHMPDEIKRPFTEDLLHKETREELPLLLENPDTAIQLLADMDAAFVALPLDFEDYEKRAQILTDLHGYVEGTYTIFPERKKEEIQIQNVEQLSLFDFMGRSDSEQEPESVKPKKTKGFKTQSKKKESKVREGKADHAEPQEKATFPEEEKEDVQETEVKTEEAGHTEETEPADLLNPEMEKKSPESENQEKTNFRITNNDLGAGGPKQRFRYNMDAILLLRKLEEENRLAVPNEQEILSRFVGWGSIPAVFDEKNDSWAAEYTELKQTLTPEEYKEARASTLNAFYTSPTVIKAMYEALGNMGLQQGNVLEPSCGIGNFMGLVPETMDGLKVYGVELDSISGKIAKQLYQKNNIFIQGFETAAYPESFFDCVIGNVPFGAYKVADHKYDCYHFFIHDYFIAKSLDLVRPGGVVAVVTSSGTMDKNNPGTRQYIANRADLLGAIRLPNNAFQRNAGTGVVADILFFQKRDRASLEQPDWVELGTTSEGCSVNSYFVKHPEMVLGEFTMENTQYGKQEITVKPIEGAILSEQLKKAIQNIQGSIMEIELEDSELEGEVISIPADPSVRNFSFANLDGKVYYRENSVMNLKELPGMTTERILGMIVLRDTTRELLQCQLEDGSDEEVAALQQKLNTQYEQFTAQYGLISSNANKRAFSQDCSYCLLSSLEILDEDGNLKRKADIFTKRTIRKAVPVTSVDTASEALAVSIGERAGVDIPFMAALSGKTEEEVVKELSGVIFKNPLTEKWEPSDEYLSGNVREKLAIARQFTENNSEYEINVQALERVQPKDLEASEIEVRLGATWVDPVYITEFMGELFHTPEKYLGKEIEVKYAGVSGQWNISGKNKDSNGNPLVGATYGTERANAYKLLEDALNLRDTKIYDTVTEDGKERRILNKKETMIAQQKQEMIKEAFQEWIFRDLERREKLCRKYNDLFNSTRPREYDGRHIQFVGMTPEISLMPHQKNAVAHILYGNNTLLAHCVGAGKTFQMVAAGMESKRLGLAQKSLYVVPNHLTEQWGSDFLRLYPGANILVATKKDFEPSNRKKFCSRIATGDFDAVIIGHSQFERIPLSRERQVTMVERQIDDISFAIAEASGEEGTRYTIKQMEKTRKTLQAKLERLNDQTRKDDVVTFEQLGVDRLFVDESHHFKNLFLHTKMRNIAGIAQTDAQKSTDMFMKCQYLDEITGGKGITFATGTPVSNSMVELYTIMRYLQYDTIQTLGLGHFDSWAAAFGETVTSIELSPEGSGYRAKTRFARFFNLPELIALFKESADVQTADILELPVPEAEYVNEVLEPSEEQRELVESFAERAERVRAGNVDPWEDNMRERYVTAINHEENVTNAVTDV